MKVWVETRLIKPPEGTVTARFGSSVMFVAYFRALDQWRWIQPYSVEERIAEPEALFLDEDYVRNNMLTTARARRDKPTRIRRGKRSEQLLFEL